MKTYILRPHHPDKPQTAQFIEAPDAQTETPVKRIVSAGQTRSPARVGRRLLKRQPGLPQEIKDAAWAAQSRLHYRYQHLTGVARKKSPVAAAALGRELSGFVWAIGRRVEPRPVKAVAGPPPPP